MANFAAAAAENDLESMSQKNVRLGLTNAIFHFDRYNKLVAEDRKSGVTDDSSGGTRASFKEK